MEENREEKMRASSRSFADTYRRTTFDVEGFIETSILGLSRKDISDHERRKYEGKGLYASEKQVKLKQIASRLRLGIIIFTFAVLGTLAFPLMFQDMLPRQREPEFVAVTSSSVGKERWMDETLNRKIKLAEKENLIYEEENQAVKMPETFDKVNKVEEFNTEEDNLAVKKSEELNGRRQQVTMRSVSLGQWRWSEKPKKVPRGNRISKSMEDLNLLSQEEFGVMQNSNHRESSSIADRNRLGAVKFSEKVVENQPVNRQVVPLRLKRQSARLKTRWLWKNKDIKESKDSDVSHKGVESARGTYFEAGSSTPDDSGTKAVDSYSFKEKAYQELTSPPVSQQKTEPGKLVIMEKTFSRGSRLVKEDGVGAVAPPGVPLNRIRHEAESEGDFSSVQKQESSFLTLQNSKESSKILDVKSIRRTDEPSEEVLKSGMEVNKIICQPFNGSMLSQQDPVVTILNKKVTELNVETLEGVDEAFETILWETNVPAQKEDSISSLINSYDHSLEGPNSKEGEESSSLESMDEMDVTSGGSLTKTNASAEKEGEVAGLIHSDNISSEGHISEELKGRSSLTSLERIDDGFGDKLEETNVPAEKEDKVAGMDSDDNFLVGLTSEKELNESSSLESLEGIDKAFERIWRENKEVGGVVRDDENSFVGPTSKEEPKEIFSSAIENKTSLEAAPVHIFSDDNPSVSLTSIIETRENTPPSEKNNPLPEVPHGDNPRSLSAAITSSNASGDLPVSLLKVNDVLEDRNLSQMEERQGYLSNKEEDSGDEVQMIYSEGRGESQSTIKLVKDAGVDYFNNNQNPTDSHENENNALREVHDNDVTSAGVTHDEILVDSTLDNQELQAEIQKENNDEWPQESVLISPLRQETASGSLRVGLLNMEATDFQRWEFVGGERPIIFPFERMNETVEWKDLYPKWIDEEQRFGTPSCPSVPMPKVDPGMQLDVVVVRAPCQTSSPLREGWKDPAYLQVLLGAASLAVKTGNGSIYVLVLSECRPLVNLFTCRDLLEHYDQGWLYKVDVEQIRKRLFLPLGSCQLTLPLQEHGGSSVMETSNPEKEAYATILHSGPDYVCGAIVAARSIRETGSTKDLIILVDESIQSEHRQGLEEAGWKVRDIEKIPNVNSVRGHLEKDFSKLRLWQLTDYSKVIYIDADLLVLRNLDILFKMPELSASGSTSTMFNSGVMVVEPSNCTFQVLMEEMQDMPQNSGGDLDFLNRVFPWWHRIPRHMNYLKYFWTRQTNEVEYMNRLFSADPPQLYAVHYWGYKPWQCYRDYDCNWNYEKQYASDEAHAQWFKVHDRLPEGLQKHCSLSTVRKAFLEYNRMAAESAAFADRHWSINISDPRIMECSESYCDWKSLLLQWGESLKSKKSTI